MERFFSPVASKIPEAENVWVLAPHADDEIFGCGGLLSLLTQRGAKIRVLVITAPKEASLAAQRVAESRKAAEFLGYLKPTHLENEDGGLAKLPVESLSHQLSDWLAEQSADWIPDLVLAPSPWEMHRDHRHVCEAAIQLCRDGLLAAPAQLGFYEVGQPLTPNLLVDISAVVERKDEAISAFVSQNRIQNYPRQLKALNVYRTYSLPGDIKAAEAYLLLPIDEIARFEQHLNPERLSAVVWRAEREVAALRTENHRLREREKNLRSELARPVKKPMRIRTWLLRHLSDLRRWAKCQASYLRRWFK